MNVKQQKNALKREREEAASDTDAENQAHDAENQAHDAKTAAKPSTCTSTTFSETKRYKNVSTTFADSNNSSIGVANLKQVGTPVQERVDVPLPMINQHNDCFINATVQLLYHNLYYRRCIRDAFQEILRTDGISKIPHALKTWAQALLLYLRTAGQATHGPVLPLDFRLLRTCYPCENENSQEDAFAVLCALFNELPKQCLFTIQKTLYVTDANAVHASTSDSRRRYGTVHSNKEGEQFIACEESSWCIHLLLPEPLKPQSSANTHNEMTGVRNVSHIDPTASPADIYKMLQNMSKLKQPKHTLHQLLQAYTNQTLASENKYECKLFDGDVLRTYHVIREVYKWTESTVLDPPVMFTIGYKRFSFDFSTSSKKCDIVDAPMVIDIAHFFNKHVPCPYEYQLKSILSHVGTDARNGHYTATVKTVDGQWRHCDDQIITLLTQPSSETIGSAYALIYERVAKNINGVFK
jgi:hypothetical protein